MSDICSYFWEEWFCTIDSCNIKWYETIIETYIYSDNTWLSLKIKICAAGLQNDGYSKQE